MEVIHLLDYQGRFGSKYDDEPYRSGFDLNLLKKEYEKFAIDPIYVPFADVNVSEQRYKGRHIVYTSAEDPGYHYKQFVEDNVLALEMSGAILLPKYCFLRATNNKVFMEMLRSLHFPVQAELFASQAFGSVDELAREKIDILKYPVVLKAAEGASGEGVFLAHNREELLRLARKISRSRDLKEEIWDIGRSMKHHGYQRESLHRKRFILQKFIPGLKNDWKVYVFGSKYYIFYRPILKHRKFKASGGGYHNYFYGDKAIFPKGIFDFAKSIFDRLNVPHVSLDIAFDGKQFYLLEFQSVYFGTAGIVKSDCYFIQQDNNDWVPRYEKHSIESVYATSVGQYILKNCKT